MGNITGYPGASGELDPTHRIATTGVKACPLGLLQMDGFNEYVYVQAGAAINVNEVVKINGTDFSDVRKTAAAADQPILGVATAAFASGDFGFVQIRGLCTALVNAAVVAGDVLSSDSGAAGTLVKSVAASLQGNKAASAVTAAASGKATVLLQ